MLLEALFEHLEDRGFLVERRLRNMLVPKGYRVL